MIDRIIMMIHAFWAMIWVFFACGALFLLAYAGVALHQAWEKHFQIDYRQLVRNARRRP